MIIKILDVSEHNMLMAEAKFKNEVTVEDADLKEKLFNLTFKEGCLLSTLIDDYQRMVAVFTREGACGLCLNEADFSEVHII